MDCLKDIYVCVYIWMDCELIGEKEREKLATNSYVSLIVCVSLGDPCVNVCIICVCIYYMYAVILMHACVCVCMYVCICVYVYSSFIFMCSCVTDHRPCGVWCASLSLCVCHCVCVSVCECVCLCVCVCVCGLWALWVYV